MTLPNKITTSRLWMTPVVFFLWYFMVHLGGAVRLGILLLWVLFALGELTDFLDGRLARKQQSVSDVGKLLDPFSDVIMRITFFVCFVSSGLMPVWPLMLILWRELGILFVRMLLVREGTVLAANRGGKAKAVLYFLAGIAGMVALTLQGMGVREARTRIACQVSTYTFVAAAIAAVISFGVYYRGYLKTETHRIFVSE